MTSNVTDCMYLIHIFYSNVLKKQELKNNKNIYI